MSAYNTGEEREFAGLLKGYANRELTTVEEDRLRELADRARSAEVREIDRVHALFEQERELFAQVTAPGEPREEADEGFQRLQQKAADAEQALRARLLHPVRPLRLLRRSHRLTWALAAAAVVLITGLLWFRGGDQAPGLLPTSPEDRTLGTPMNIPLTAQMDAVNRSVAWLGVPGARTYEVRVEDGAGNLVLERADDQASRTRWDLTEAQFALLKGARQPLILRVVARDGAGITVGTTGDLPLSLR